MRVGDIGKDPNGVPISCFFFRSRWKRGFLLFWVVPTLRDRVGFSVLGFLAEGGLSEGGSLRIGVLLTFGRRFWAF